MNAEIRAYRVGGAVRDQLLGLPSSDCDWVVVGATPERMTAQGFLPVGADFPVFLHPETHEEYALARTERKSGRGYKGFTVYASPEVTLEEDLSRRDFTINAMALDADGQLIDPYGGQQDLRAGILRHVSPAFAEDPVRILRGARFSARFGFAIAPETLALMQQMVAEGEVDALVPERVWQELARGLMEAHPSRFLQVLRDAGALGKILPEVEALFGVPQPAHYHPEIDCGIHTQLVLDAAARKQASLPVRFAALCHDLGKGNTPKELLPKHHGHEMRGAELAKQLCARLKVPGDCRDLALLAARYHTDLHRAAELRPATLVKLFDAIDLWRKPERLEDLIAVAIADAHGRTGHESDTYPQAELLRRAALAARSIDAGSIARACSDRQQIPLRIHEARVAAVASVLAR